MEALACPTGGVPDRLWAWLVGLGTMRLALKAWRINRCIKDLRAIRPMLSSSSHAMLDCGRGVGLPQCRNLDTLRTRCRRVASTHALALPRGLP